MATLRKKVLSGKITGKEYVEMVYRHLEMRALGFLEEEPSSEEMAAPAAAASGPSRESRLKAIATGMATAIAMAVAVAMALAITIAMAVLRNMV